MYTFGTMHFQITNIQPLGVKRYKDVTFERVLGGTTFISESVGVWGSWYVSNIKDKIMMFKWVDWGETDEMWTNFLLCFGMTVVFILNTVFAKEQRTDLFYITDQLKMIELKDWRVESQLDIPRVT